MNLIGSLRHRTEYTLTETQTHMQQSFTPSTWLFTDKHHTYHSSWENFCRLITTDSKGALKSLAKQRQQSG